MITRSRAARQRLQQTSGTHTIVGQIYQVGGARMAINYGSDRVRFITPVRVGSRIRASSLLRRAEHNDDAVQVTVVTTIEIDGAGKPAAVIEHLGRYYF
jgi:acyl dehydratase